MSSGFEGQRLFEGQPLSCLSTALVDCSLDSAFELLLLKLLAQRWLNQWFLFALGHFAWTSTARRVGQGRYTPLSELEGPPSHRCCCYHELRVISLIFCGCTQALLCAHGGHDISSGYEGQHLSCLSTALVDCSLDSAFELLMLKLLAQHCFPFALGHFAWTSTARCLGEGRYMPLSELEGPPSHRCCRYSGC